jgi:hypothetical protein
MRTSADASGHEGDGMARWFSDQDEAQEQRLLAAQPESSGELSEFLGRLGSRVTEAVMNDDRVRERLSGVRHEILAVDYREEKPEEGWSSSRAAQVGIYDYDRDVLVVAAFDLHSGAVSELDEREGAAPPIASAEFDRARELVGDVPGIGEALRREDSDAVAFPTPSYAFDANPRRARHRGCTLYATAGSGEVVAATVDLSAMEVVPDDELPDILRPDRTSPTTA